MTGVTYGDVQDVQGRRETGRAPGLGQSWGPTVEGCKTFFGLRH